MMWFLVILGLCIWWMSGYRTRRRLKQIAKELPTNIPAMPLVGQAYLYFGTDEDRMKALQKLGRDAIQQGGTIAYWQGSELNVGVADPVVADLLLKSCLSKDYNIMKLVRIFIGNGSLSAPGVADPVVADLLLKSCLSKDYNIMKLVRIFIGNGSLSAPVHIWRPRRKVLSPVFSPKNLNGFSEVFAKQSAKMVELLGQMAGAGEFSIWKYITTYTFDAVCETNLGVKIDSQEHVNHSFLEAFEKVVASIASRMCQPWLHSEILYRMMPSYRICKQYVDSIDNFVSKIIHERRNKLNANGNDAKKDTISDPTESKSRTLLEMVMESPGKERSLNDEEVIEEVKTVVSAGTDTSAVGACFTLVLLSRYPDVQEAVYKELYEVFGDSDREVNVKDLPNLKYLEMVIKESLRLYPPVPAIVREVNSDIKLPNGTTLGKGVGIVMYIWAVHRNHHYWGDDAEHFRPERFLEPLKHPAQFIPFSYGMRNCVGYQYAMMSLKTVLATVLRRYRVLPPQGMAPARYHEPLRVKFNIMMKPVDDFVVRLEKRT